MPRRASFAEISRTVTKNKAAAGGSHPEQLGKRSVSSGKLLKKSKFADVVEKNLGRRARKKNSKQAGEDKGGEKEEEEQADAAPEEEKPESSEQAPEGGAEAEPEDGTAEIGGDNGEGEEADDAELFVLGGGEDAAVGEEEDEKEDEKEDEEAEEERTAEEEAAAQASRKQRFKKMTKKQRLLEEERLEEERARNARRARRAERKRKIEEQEELAKMEAPQSLDEVAFRGSIYELVKTALSLIMNQENINITVDNLPPVMKGFELDTGDEDVKDLIMEALLDSYGVIEPGKIDALVMKKEAEKDLDELEECIDTAFDIIDQDRDGLITQNDIYRLMIHLGEVLWDTQVAAILNAADIDGDGKISKKDLFLFMLGREKTVKLEDQILSNYGNKADESSKEDESAPADSSSTTTATKEAPPEKSATSTPSSTPATTTTTSLAARLKAADPPEDVAAAARRRKMMAGYSKMAMAANAFGGGTESETKGSTETTVEPAATDAVQEASATESPAVTTIDVSDKSNEGDSALLPAPKVGSDWSDSGHPGSERDEDTCGGDDDEDDDAFMCGPLALDASIAYLPAPEFCSVASPRTPRTPRSRRSSCSRQSMSPRPKSREILPCGSPSAIHKPTPDSDLDHAAEAMPSARTEQTSEYDSEREGANRNDDFNDDDDEDVLPETSQQNHILREIEKQVLHAKEALSKTKDTARPPSDRYAARVDTSSDPGDGCESVVESEIHPVYVPPCAREVSRSRRFGGSNLDLEERARLPPGVTLGDLSVAEGSKLRSDKTRMEQPAVGDTASTCEILSKGYVSLSTPRSFSTLTTTNKPRLYDDDGLLPGEDAAYASAAAAAGHGDYAREILVQTAMETCQWGAEKAIFDEDIQVEVTVADIDEDAFENKAEEEEAGVPQQDVLVDGVPSAMRPVCQRPRMLSARKEQPSPLRRSLTCHVVTVKDLSLSLNSSPSGSPARREFHRQSSVVGKHSGSFSPHRNDSPGSRREPSGSPAVRRRQYFSPSGGGGGGSPSCRSDTNFPKVGRVYSPLSRVDSFRSAPNMESARSNNEASTTRSPGRNWESLYWDSARGQRDSSRSQKDAWKSQRSSHLSRRDSFRGTLTARSGERTNRSQQGDDEEVEPEEEFRFIGPNFDTIMRQKGEPEEHMQESLYRDAVARSGEAPSDRIFDDFRPPAAGGRAAGGGAEEGSPAPGETRRVLVSRQLERVKQMETLILQRRANMAKDSDDDDAGAESAREASPHGHLRSNLRRAKSTLQMAGANPADLSSRDVATWVAGGAAPHKARPKSCISGRRRGVSSSSLKVVTITDSIAGDMSPSSTTRCSSNNASPARGSPARLDSPGRVLIGSPGRISNAGSPGRPLINSPGRASGMAASPGTASGAHSYIARDGADEEPKVHVVDLTSLLDKVNEPDTTDEDSAKVPSGGGSPGAGGGGNHEQRRNSRKFKPLARMLVAYERARRRQADVAAGSSEATSISRKLEQGIPYRPPSPPRQHRDDHSPAGLSRRNRWRKDNAHHQNLVDTAGGHTAATAHIDEIETVHAAQRRGMVGGAHHAQASSASFVLSGDQKQDGDDDDHPLVKSLLDAFENDEGDGSPFRAHAGYGSRAAAGNSALNFEFPERSVCKLKPKPVVVVRTDNS